MHCYNKNSDIELKFIRIIMYSYFWWLLKNIIFRELNFLFFIFTEIQFFNIVKMDYQHIQPTNNLLYVGISQYKSRLNICVIILSIIAIIIISKTGIAGPKADTDAQVKQKIQGFASKNCVCNCTTPSFKGFRRKKE